MAYKRLQPSDEVWKPIPGHDGYEASSLGRIRSVDRVIYHGGKRIPVRRLHGRILKLQTNAHGGHLHVQMANKTYRVQRLIMLTFVGECPEGLEVCHNVANVNNNRLDNLRYDTRISNRADMKKNMRKT
jgi:hypothetical protein